MTNWTDELDDTLVAFLRAGVSYSEIAQRMSQVASRGAVAGRLSRLRRKNMAPPASTRRRALQPVAPTPQARARAISQRCADLVGALRDDQCRHISGDVLQDETWSYCDRTAEPGLPYCRLHAAGVYTREE